ncbi:class I SAM-dependent methyltransferase [Nannocystis punicea]|uniref:Class I SAM-dependent methyltransferase n=1 Tax=Nannocystis punicea TaxID=2995304 RepID=A0ABY7H9H7_9BACT|nr:class I SAM-dependent methyltransferase [Nannocystis poenicansa]WAS95793.1 class I SAM-dependent methyltransferase [Nannocystis poenicansa]
MSEFWENAFVRMQMMWGEAPTRAALLARDDFAARGVKHVLIPGIGYGRNATPFIEVGMSVTGIEVSGTAIDLARSKMGLEIPIFHGSVTDMPFDERRYDGIFCFGLIYLLDAAERAKLLHDCANQLAPGGTMIFTVVSKAASMFGQGTKIGEDRYQMEYGVRLFFYDADSIRREFGAHGLVDFFTVDEAMPDGSLRPFLQVVCRSGA